MKVLVTGASGFIGHHLTKLLLTQGHSVASLARQDGDIASRATWDKIGETDIVVHLAGKTSVPQSWEEPDEYHRVNVGGVEQAIEFCKTRVSKLVYLSSFVYLPKDDAVFSESDETGNSNPYAETKIVGERLCQEASERFNLSTVVLRPFNAYGPGQSESFLIARLMKLVRNRSLIEVTDLEPKRDYIYVTDLVEAIAAAMLLDVKFELFNVGTGISHSVAEVIENLFTIAGYRCEISSSNERRRNEVMDTRANIEKARRLMIWQPGFDLDSGLRAMWAEFAP